MKKRRSKDIYKNKGKHTCLCFGGERCGKFSMHGRDREEVNN